ncbi:MAG: dTDP-4-dehydrorhamnose 3,5-epimerase [Oscillospiraceae bacterium]|jgi:dTDP-4-dehydrorhamnose 3,5-epimerase|nr:dTDP-4-dehydrorhamnose 3,5-epimerase [Oscillospiraceae bacterium]
MKVVKTKLRDVYILEPEIFEDQRGWFMESWSAKKMDMAGLHYAFVQDNHSFSSRKGVLRGLHYQKGDHAQAKLIRCICGAVLDVAVDLRKGSPTFKQWMSIELTAENRRQLLIPRGLAHGFVTLTDEVEFFYKADHYYDPDSERGILWNDPEIGIDWPVDIKPILSEKDSAAPLLSDSDYDFEYGRVI